MKPSTPTPSALTSSPPASATGARLKAAVIQQACQPSQAENLDKSVQLIEEAAEQGAQLVLLQELHTTLYFCQTESLAPFDLAEPLNGPTFQRLSSTAQRLNTVIVGSIFERRACGIYHNTALVIERDGSLAGYYRKMHIPDDPGFYEKYYFTPGDAPPETKHRTDSEQEGCGFQPINTSVGRLGVLVCWDQWYPEAARLMALAGADLLLYPTAIGWDSRDEQSEQQRQRDAWATIQRSHAIANHLPVLVANRSGHEPDPSSLSPGIDFWGGSFIAGPQGELLADPMCSNSEGPLIAELNLNRTEQLRRIWPFFRDRRVDAYSDLTRRFRD